MKASEPAAQGGATLMDVVIHFLEDEEWHYQVLEPGAVARAGVRSERGTWICYLRVDEERGHVVCHFVMGLNIPADNRADVLEYLNRANFILPLGNFEMDMDSGEIRFKTGVEAAGGRLSEAMVRSLALAGLRATERYFPGVLKIVHSGLSPAAALARIEAQAVGEE